MPQIKTLIDSLWVNINLATFAESEGYGIIEDAAMAIADGKIVWIGKRGEIPKDFQAYAKETHDAEGLWATPGLIDCHTHLVYAGDRAKEFEARLQGKSYEEIARAGGGILNTVMATRAASEELLYEQSFERACQAFDSGTTTMEIKSGYGLDLATEMKMLRVARKIGEMLNMEIITTYLGAHAIPPEFVNNADGYVDFICETVLPKIAAEKLADAVDGFCEHIAFNRDQVRKIFNSAKQWNLPVKLHAEQLSDQRGAILASEFHALSCEHLEYVTEEAVQTMAQSGVTAVLLPGAFYFLRETQIPPINLFHKYQVPIALATDCNPGTSPTTSLLLMANMACVFWRFTPEQALRSITLNAARALRLDKSHGSLAVGKNADFVLWEITHPRDLVYYFGHNPCAFVIKKGIIHEPNPIFAL